MVGDHDGHTAVAGLGDEAVPRDEGIAHVEQRRADDHHPVADPDGAGEHRRDHAHVRHHRARQAGVGPGAHTAQDPRSEHRKQHGHDHDPHQEPNPIDTVDVHPHDVGDVAEQERPQAEHEEVAGKHEEHVAGEAEDEGGHEPRPHGLVGRIQREGTGDEQHQGEGLAQVLEGLLLLVDGEPVEERRGEGQREQQERRAVHPDHLTRRSPPFAWRRPTTPAPRSVHASA